MRQILIHAGRAKTGTTALQNFAFDNRDRLRESGILYPLTGICDNGHHAIAGAFFRPPPLWMKTEHSLEEYLSMIEAECIEANVDRVVLSSEGFQGADLNELRNLRPHLDIRAFMLVRRQDRFFESIIAQEIKVGFLDFIPPWSSGFYEMVLDHLREADIFGDIIGPNALHIRTYDENTDIFKEFCDFIGHPVNDREHFARRDIISNPSLNSTNLEICLILSNILKDIENRDRFVYLLHALDDEISRGDEEDWWKSGCFLPVHERRSLLEFFEKRNEILFNKYNIPYDFCQFTTFEQYKYDNVKRVPLHEVFDKIRIFIIMNKEFESILSRSRNKFIGNITRREFELKLCCQ